MDFPATLEHLSEAMEYLRAQTASLAIEEKLAHKIELACEEAIVNVIFYAYPEQKGNLSITCTKTGKRLEIVLQDTGIPFNPIDAEINTQSDVPVQERKIGGLGIFLLRRIIDEAIYQREGNTNILRLVFNVS